MSRDSVCNVLNGRFGRIIFFQIKAVMMSASETGIYGEYEVKCGFIC